MNCYQLINHFWREHYRAPFSPAEFAVFHYIVRCYDVSHGLNPIEIPTRDFEVRLRISRNTLIAARNTLRERGLITFIEGSRNQAPLYTLIFIPVSASSNATKRVPDCVSSSVTYNDTLSNISNISTESNNSDDEEKNLTNACARENNPAEDSDPMENTLIAEESASAEDSDLQRFDSFAGEITAGRHQIWADQMAARLGIASVGDYLPQFRAHLIRNDKLDRIRSMKEFKQYFNVAFRYFAEKTPAQLLAEFRNRAPESAVNFRNYCDWFSKQFPRLHQGLIPLTENEFNYIFSRFPNDAVVDALCSINDYPAALERHRTLYEPLLYRLERNRSGNRNQKQTR